MEYIYAAMLLHKAGKKIDEASVKKVLEAAGAKADATRIKALVAALEGVNIDKAIEKTAVTAPTPQPSAEAPVQEEKKEEKKTEEEAAAGLGTLFG